MTEVETTLAELGFDKGDFVAGRASVADLFLPGNRSGIYVLRFANGELYVGRTVDFSRRYVQHRKHRPDIEHVHFKSVEKDEQPVEEARIARLLDSSKLLRNIQLVSVHAGNSDLDEVISPSDQEKWLAAISQQNPSGDRADDPCARRRYRGKYDEFLTYPRVEDVVTVLRRYVSLALLSPALTEMSFWAASCLPSSSKSDFVVYSRINVYQQEVFTAGLYRGEPSFLWHLAKSVLQAHFGDDLLGLVHKYPWASVEEHIYPSGGPDQVCIGADGHGHALKLLRDACVLNAMKVFNLRLMRKGPCFFSRYHCLDLADQFFKDTGPSGYSSWLSKGVTTIRRVLARE